MPSDLPMPKPESQGGWVHTDTQIDLYAKTKLLAREMRREPTIAENHLW